jgi:phosphoribulokinase
MLTQMAMSPNQVTNDGTPSLLRPKPAQIIPPLMIGVVGDSGSGKSTLVRGFHQIFRDYTITEICLDDYHRYDRAERKQRKITALHPAANKLALIQTHLEALRRGATIQKPVYSHATGTFTKPETVTPGQVVIVHGLFTLFSPNMRNLFDLSVYLDPEPGLRVAWKIKRDTERRGYNLREVLAQIEERRYDVATYIEPQKYNADLILRFCRPSQVTEICALRSEIIWQGQPFLAQPFEGNSPFLNYQPIRKGGKLVVSHELDMINALYLANVMGSNLPPFLFTALGQYQTKSGIQQSYSLLLSQILLSQQLLKARPDFYNFTEERLGA